MARVSELERLLHGQLGGLELDSSGKFTVAREEALQRLAAFQLPDGQAWVLKVVQAVVAVSSARLVIRQTRSDTEFEFTAPDCWTLERLEEEFFSPEVSSDRGFDHLKRALWFTGLKGERPFLFSLPQLDQSLLWNGKSFQRKSSATVNQATLIIAHKGCHQSALRSIFDCFQVSRVNADLLLSLRRAAFSAPLELTLDSRRIDGLQNCPDHGAGRNCFPLALNSVWGSALPAFRVSSLTLDWRPVASFAMGYLLQEYRPPEHRSLVDLVYLVSAHLKLAVGRIENWTTCSELPSSLFWLRDGVVVERELIDHDLKGLSLAIFVSTDELHFDLSGFRIIPDEAYQSRLQEILREYLPAVRKVSISLKGLIDYQERLDRILGRVALVGGFYTIPFGVGLLVAARGWQLARSPGQNARALQAQLAGQLEKLSPPKSLTAQFPGHGAGNSF